ncbi:NlpC/P60 family protein [Bergeriella denitrificans]|uniref:Phage associated protein n=1 Tax=Bergeriella denitrificans TaxID=494 RepID=A0A378UJP6_BERDE|nr:NlpC/P60 family protein [Bergeriella denitrificans]STZ77340.1 phage associated protein [Bergeriella denitrificans]
MNLREQIAAEAASWLGTPYHHQAMVKGAGVDCAMILVAVYGKFGLLPPDFDPRPYPQDWHLHRDAERYLGYLMQFGREITESELQKGDVAVWKFGRAFSHGGICLDGTGLIHSYIGRGVVLDDRYQAELAHREVRYFSFIQ